MAPPGFRHLKNFLHKDQKRSGEAVHVGNSRYHASASRPQQEGMGQNTVRTCWKSALVGFLSFGKIANRHRYTQVEVKPQ